MTLLTDTVGGLVDIDFMTEESGSVSTLTISLNLTWEFSEIRRLSSNVGEIFGNSIGEKVPSALADILNDIIPDEGGEINLETGLSYSTSASIEHETFDVPSIEVPDLDDMSFSATKCFVLGGDATGLSLSFTGSGITDFRGAIGSLGASVSSAFDLIDEGISLEVWAFDLPDARIEIDLDDITASVSDAILKFVPSFDGSIDLSILADVPLLDLNLKLDLSFPDLNAFFEGVVLKIGDVMVKALVTFLISP